MNRGIVYAHLDQNKAMQKLKRVIGPTEGPHCNRQGLHIYPFALLLSQADAELRGTLYTLSNFEIGHDTAYFRRVIIKMCV